MKKFINTLLFAAVLVIASSCTQNELPVEEPTPEGAPAEVVLRLRAPENFRGARSTTNTAHAAENEIADVFVFVFNEDDELTLIRQGRDINPTAPDWGSAAGSFTVTLPASNVRLMVLANVGSVLTLAQRDALGFPDRSYDAVIAAIQGTINGRMFPGNNTLIPMWGEETAASLIVPNTPRPTIGLHRAIARVDVGVGTFNETAQTWAGLDNFELTDVFVMKPNNRFAVVPTDGLVPDWQSANVHLTTPTVPGETGQFNLTESKNGFHFTPNLTTPSPAVIRSIYVPESNIKNPIDGVAVTAPHSGDANHLNRMAVVVGGRYNGGAITYYRIDFATGPHNSRQLVNVLRNHLYRISIAAVTGPGEATPEEAYNATSVNMNVDVIDWNEVDMGEIFVDGVHWIRLQNSFNENLSRRAVLYRPAGSVDRIHFETNIPLEEWTMEIDPDGDEIALTAEDRERGVLRIIENDLFRVELIEVQENGQNITIHHGHFRFIALVDENVAPSTLTVETRRSEDDPGRIRFPIIIEQRGDAPDDWWDGGNQDVDVGRQR